MVEEAKKIKKSIISRLRTLQINSLITEIEDLKFKNRNLRLGSYRTNYETSTQNKKDQMLDYLRIRSERLLKKGANVEGLSSHMIFENMLNPSISKKKLMINAIANRLLFEFLKNSSISNEKLLMRALLWLYLRQLSLVSGNLLISEMEEDLI